MRPDHRGPSLLRSPANWRRGSRSFGASCVSNPMGRTVIDRLQQVLCNDNGNTITVPGGDFSDAAAEVFNRCGNGFDNSASFNGQQFSVRPPQPACDYAGLT